MTTCHGRGRNSSPSVMSGSNDPAGAAVELLIEPVKRLVADRAFVA
jgi:hypothetical protein